MKTKVIFYPRMLGGYCLLEVKGKSVSGTLLDANATKGLITVKTVNGNLTIKVEE